MWYGIPRPHTSSTYAPWGSVHFKAAGLVQFFELGYRFLCLCCRLLRCGLSFAVPWLSLSAPLLMFSALWLSLSAPIV